MPFSMISSIAKRICSSFCHIDRVRKQPRAPLPIRLKPIHPRLRDGLTQRARAVRDHAPIADQPQLGRAANIGDECERTGAQAWAGADLVALAIMLGAEN